MDLSLKSSNSEKLLGITIDSDSTFEEHINTLCRKASQKLHALSSKNFTIFITTQKADFNQNIYDVTV